MWWSPEAGREGRSCFPFGPPPSSRPPPWAEGPSKQDGGGGREDRVRAQALALAQLGGLGEGALPQEGTHQPWGKPWARRQENPQRELPRIPPLVKFVLGDCFSRQQEVREEGSPVPISTLEAIATRNWATHAPIHNPSAQTPVRDTGAERGVSWTRGRPCTVPLSSHPTSAGEP